MVSHLFFSQLVLLVLLWLCVMLHYAWSNTCTAGDQRPSKPLPPPRKRSSDSKPFPGLTRTPPCAACEQAHEHGPHARTAAPSGHLAAFLPASGLCISGLGGMGQSQCQWTSYHLSTPM